MTRASSRPSRKQRSGPFWSAPLPRRIAHRGLATTAPENTIAAFQDALDAGATHLESDLRASSDGVAVLFHDPDVALSDGTLRRISDCTLDELHRLPLASGARIPTLDEALAAFPDTAFNLDMKSADVVAPAVAAIRQRQAAERVLIASFSRSRRLAALRQLPGAATSPSAVQLLAALLAVKLRLGPLARLLLRRIDAVQLPVRILGMDASSARIIAGFRAGGAEVHYWTINDPAEMRRLLANGADGLVSDRVDLVTALTQ